MMTLAFGFMAGIGCACAWRWRTQRLLSQARATAKRSLDGARARADTLQEQLEHTRTQLERERAMEGMRRIRESAWAEGYNEGLREGEERQAARQFVTQFEHGASATMMIRKGRV